MLADRALLLSLKPVYANLILEGTKSVELRHVRPRAQPGTLAIVYASTPVRAVVGTCAVKSIGQEHPDVIWELHGARTGLRWHEFHDYFLGRRSAVAISVERPKRLDLPIPLDVIRSEPLRVSPPQSFRYLGGEQAAALIPQEWRDHLDRLRGSAALH